jgi:hypothetical protein
MATLSLEQGGQAGPGPGDLLYSTYFGGLGADEISAVAIDAQNNMYVIGTFDTGNPVLDTDVFVAKLRADGRPVWALTFGSAGPNRGTGIDVDAQGNVYICGTFRNAFGVQNSFMAKLNPDGNQFLWRRNVQSMPTPEGLPNGVSKIHYHAPSNRVYYAAFLTVDRPDLGRRLAGGLGRLNAGDGSTVDQGAAIVAYFFAQNHIDMTGVAIGIDQAGNAYVANQVVDYDRKETGTWLGHINSASLFRLDWSNLYTAAGTNGPADVVADAGGFSYLVGYATTADTGLVLSEMKHTPAGQLTYSFTSSVVPDSPSTQGRGVVIDAQGRSYVTGSFTTPTGNQNVFLSRITPRQVDKGYEFDLDTLTFGGSGDDRGLALAAQLNPALPAYAVVVGVTNSDTDFPVTDDAFQPQYGGGDSDGFITRIRLPGR